MDQSAYSQIVLAYLQGHRPEFLPSVHFQDDNSFDCRVVNPRGSLYLWIATYDIEITVGFEYIDQTCPWHTHMSLFSAYDVDQELAAMNKLLLDIFSGKQVIATTESGLLYLTDDTTIKENDGENVIFKNWDDFGQ